MTRKEFINAWCKRIDEGRCANYPDMRPSERAMAMVDDKEEAGKYWRKWRHDLRELPVSALVAEISGKKS